MIDVAPAVPPGARQSAHYDRVSRQLIANRASKAAVPDCCLIDFLTGVPFPDANGCLRGHRTA